MIYSRFCFKAIKAFPWTMGSVFFATGIERPRDEVGKKLNERYTFYDQGLPRVTVFGLCSNSTKRVKVISPHLWSKLQKDSLLFWKQTKITTKRCWWTFAAP